MSGHTPGTRLEYHPDTHTLRAWDAGGRVDVAKLNGYAAQSFGPEREGRWNAHADLLAALRELVFRAELASGHLGAEGRRACDAARAAIAKAGEP